MQLYPSMPNPADSPVVKFVAGLAVVVIVIYLWKFIRALRGALSDLRAMKRRKPEWEGK